jgi:hypothetical protein
MAGRQKERELYNGNDFHRAYEISPRAQDFAHRRRGPGGFVRRIWCTLSARLPSGVFVQRKKDFSILGLMMLVVALGPVSPLSARAARGQDADGPMSELTFVVVRDYNGKAVRNAAVVLHPVNRKGKQSAGGLELKTDNEGRTNIDGIPYGPLRIQVLAPGFQTFGEDYEINKPHMEITVKLKRPGGQYSIYDNAQNEKKPDDKKTDDKKTDDKKIDDKKSDDKTPPDPKPQP